MATSGCLHQWIAWQSGTTSIPYEYNRLDVSLSYLEPELEFKPVVHQKLTMERQHIPIVEIKGIGFQRMFKGYRYPIGNKKP